MKVWDASGFVVYDNQIGACDDADPVTGFGGQYHHSLQKFMEEDGLSEEEVGKKVFLGTS